MRSFSATLLIILFLTGCDPDKHTEVKTGTWRAELRLQGQSLPFNFELLKSGEKYQANLINAGEKLLLDEIQTKDDSVIIGLHIFDATIKAKIQGDSLTGLFIKNYEKDYKVPFRAKYGQAYRFPKGTANDSTNFDGKFKVTFISPVDTVEAVGIFHQSADSVTGTFLTTTGDYRYLQGNVADGKLQLSTFDGNHAYLFTAIKNTNGTLTGDYYSGKTFHAKWTAIKDDNATLADAESLTYLKPGFEKIEFTFPDIEGNKLSLDDPRFKNKVVILQLMGSWCPNCMDETRFLVPWYEKNKERGIEIIGLAYERKPDFAYASGRVKNMINKLGITYPVAIAGVNDKNKAAETLPMLNAVVAFPTTIFIGRDGKVKKIHTGFSGPGTGVYYEQFVEHFNATVSELLK